MNLIKFSSLVLCMLLLVSLIGCGETPTTSDETTTVQNPQVRVLEAYNNLSILATGPDSDWPEIIEVSENSGIYIYYYDLARILHVYELTRAEEGETILTADEAMALYNEWDEEKGEQLEHIASWYRHFGEIGVHRTYRSGMSTAHRIYKDNEGEALMPVGVLSWPLETLLELEEYTRQNPDFEEENADYQALLKYLGIEKP